MKGIRQALCFVCALFVPLLALPRTARGQLLHADPASVERAVQDALKAWQVPGVALAIVHGDRVVYLRGFGVRRAGGKDSVTPDTVFAIGSCSKPITALALAMLMDEGKLDWDDRVRKHVEFFRLADPLADGDVRLRDLLCHRTGLDSHDLLWYRAPWGQEEMIRRAGRLQPSGPFRASFHYQSVMFGAAGHAVGTASKSTWQDFVRTRIFTPLAMTSTTVTTDEAARQADRATPHRKTADGKVTPRPWYEMHEPNPAGSINSTARDLANFLRLQLAEGSFQGKRLVSAENLLETRTPQVALPVKGPAREMYPDTLQMSYGMGWVIQDYRGQLVNLHGGAIDGFRVQLTLLPAARAGIALLNNLDNTQMNLALTCTLIDLMLGLPPRDWNAHYGALVRAREDARKAADEERQAKRHRGTNPSRELSAYVGVYEDQAYGTARVTLEGGRLVWQWSTFRCPLEHWHFDTFAAPHEHLVDAQVRFTLDDDGAVATLHALGRDFVRTNAKP